MDIFICVGSSCHLKGSYSVINTFKEKVAENHLESKANLMASFCLGTCTDGVAVRVGDQMIHGVFESTAAEKWDNEIMPLLNKQMT